MTTNEKKQTEKETKTMTNKKKIGIIAVATATVAAVIISMLCFSSCNKVTTSTPDEVGTSVQAVTQVVTDAQGNTHIEEETKIVEVKQTQPSEKSESNATNETKSTEKAKSNNGSQSSSSGVTQTNNRPGNSQSGSSSSSSGQTSKPSAQGGSSEQSKPSGSQSSQPQATKPQPTTTADPHAGKTWHEAEYKEVYHPAETEKVWIVDVPADTWQRPIYGERYGVTICNTCGADITDCCAEHGKQHMINGENFSYHDEWREDIIGYETVVEPEEGHYETKVIKEAYTEKVLVKEEGWY